MLGTQHTWLNLLLHFEGGHPNSPSPNIWSTTSSFFVVVCRRDASSHLSSRSDDDDDVDDCAEDRDQRTNTRERAFRSHSPHSLTHARARSLFSSHECTNAAQRREARKEEYQNKQKKTNSSTCFVGFSTIFARFSRENLRVRCVIVLRAHFTTLLVRF